MTTAPNNNLSRQKILQLLISVGSKQTVDDTQSKAVKYDWHKPHRFNTKQLQKLNDFLITSAISLSGKFTDMCQGDFSVTIDSLEQLFIDTLGDPSDSQPCDYYLAFSNDQTGPCGFMGISSKNALIWTTQLIGESEDQEDTERKLSSLEESFLFDIATGVIEAFWEPSDEYVFMPAEELAFKHIPIKLQTAEITRITFKVQRSETEDTVAHIIILSEMLDSIATKHLQHDNKVSNENILKAIIERLSLMTLSVDTQLASTELTFEQIMGLQVNDILLLDKKVEEPAEIIIDNQLTLYGRAAKSAGKYAVVITEPQENDV